MKYDLSNDTNTQFPLSSCHQLNKVFSALGPEPVHEIENVNVVHEPALDQMLYLVLSLLGSNVQCGVEILGRAVDCGAVLQQQHYDVYVAQARSYVQWCLLFLDGQNKSVLRVHHTISRYMYKAFATCIFNLFIRQ